MGHWKTPQEENRGDCSPCFQLCPGQSEGGPESCYKIHPNESLPPSQQGATPQKHQTNCNSRESNRNSSSTASQTGSRGQHRTCQQLPLGDMEPNPHGVSSVLSQPQVQVLSRGSRAVPGSCSIILPTPRAPPVSAISHSHPDPEGTCPGTMELQGCCRSSSAPLRIPCRHRRNTPEPSRITMALGQVLYQRELPGSFRTFLPPSQANALSRQRAEAALGKDKE